MVFRQSRKVHRLAHRLGMVLPVALFAGGMAFLQWIAGMPVTRLWLKTAVACLAAMAAVRVLPWDRWLFRLHYGTRLFHAALFALFVRHFASVLLEEARRALAAHAVAAPRRYRAAWFGSLGRATGGLLARSLVRAERFHAAQSLRGIGE